MMRVPIVVGNCILTLLFLGGFFIASFATSNSSMSSPTIFNFEVLKSTFASIVCFVGGIYVASVGGRFLGPNSQKLEHRFFGCLTVAMGAFIQWIAFAMFSGSIV